MWWTEEFDGQNAFYEFKQGDARIESRWRLQGLMEVCNAFGVESWGIFDESRRTRASVVRDLD